MRLRHIPGSEETVLESPFVVSCPEQAKGRWSELFHSDNPIEIEIGMGKGKFIMELAAQNPNVNYVGIERYSSVLLKGLQKRREMELDNIYFICADARCLADVFAPGEVSRIYLNFSDPWPKERHAKRRLTSRQFMEVYDKILKKEGLIEFKTDNRDLFDYSLQSIPAAGWNVLMSTTDLHNSEYLSGNVMTEYESKFVAEGKPICKLTACRQPA